MEVYVKFIDMRKNCIFDPDTFGCLIDFGSVPVNDYKKSKEFLVECMKKKFGLNPEHFKPVFAKAEFRFNILRHFLSSKGCDFLPLKEKRAVAFEGTVSNGQDQLYEVNGEIEVKNDGQTIAYSFWRTPMISDKPERVEGTMIVKRGRLDESLLILLAPDR